MRLARSSLLRHLRMFCVCARSLSFKSAAQILHLTPSAISHQIRELEDQLGVQLFVRRTRALELTPVGRSLLAEVEPLLLAVEEAVARISADPERKSVNVAMPPFFASELVIPRLSSLYAANPGIAVQLDTHDAMPRDHSSGADISVIIAESPARGLESHELFPLRLVGACSLEIRARLDQLGSVALSQVPVVVHRMLPGVWDQWAAESGFAPPPPRNVKLDASELTNSSTLQWDVDPAVAGYRIVWRATDSATWQHARDVGRTGRATMDDISKDNVIFGVMAVSARGHTSLAAYPLPLVRR